MPKPWVSLHVHYGEDHDSLLCDGLSPLVDRLLDQRRIDSFFFIRYLERGPHIRLRLQPTQPEQGEAVRRCARDALLAYLERKPSRYSLRGIAGHAAVWRGGNPRATFPNMLPDNRVVAARYEPEYERYGGPDGIEAAHRVFRASSDIALAVVRQTMSDASSRLGAALILMLSGALALFETPVRLAEFFSDYARAGRTIGGVTRADSCGQIRSKKTAPSPLAESVDTGDLLTKCCQQQ